MHQTNTTFNTEKIEIHIRTYRSLLKSSGKLEINKMIDSHKQMNSILHEKAASEDIDIAAFIYVLLRLPVCMSNVKNIILGQSYDVFAKHGFTGISKWQEVEAPGRKRKMFYDKDKNLAVYIASVTDVDDIITLLTAFQIEWNKFHHTLKSATNLETKVVKFLKKEDIERIKKIWGEDYLKFLIAIKERKVDFTLQLLAGSYVEYTKATHKWWANIMEKLKTMQIETRPIYFVSSNTHSITNLLTRFVLDEEKTLIEYLYQLQDQRLTRLWNELQNGDFLASKDNFLYYLAKKYARFHPEFLKKKSLKEKRLGISFLPASHYLDIDSQMIEVRNLSNITFDPHIDVATKHLAKSNALIINIDYPLGWAAYLLLTEIGQHIANLRGIYIMGKAATLNGQIGDILIPTNVFDQHTKNIYVFDNAFSASDFYPIFKTGMVLDKQKTVSAKGTFLENSELIKKWYREGYTIIEMESGPYLNAIYEFVYYNRYEENQFVSLVNAPFEIGIAHYASDTPYSKAKNLGVRSLSFEGVEPTYAISQIILKKIIEKEKEYID